MARRAKGLTARAAETLGTGYHADGGGLYLQVTGTGGRSWIFRYQHNKGKRRDMGLGPVYLVGLAEARRLALECRRLLFEGIDPLERKRSGRASAALEAAKAISFREAAEQYVAAHKTGWRSPKSQQQWQGSLRDYAFPALGNLPVQAIDVGLVLKAIEPIWATKPETASRVRGRIESILDWASARGYRQGENPARWRGHLENLLPKKSKVRPIEHFAALPYIEIGAFLAELRQQDSVAARALEFAILTAARPGEAIGARWDEINIGERLWTIPAARTKSCREHRVPLSNAAMAVIEQMAVIRHSEHVFPGRLSGRAIGDTTIFDLLRGMRREITAHGFRSSFRDWAGEQTNFAREVAEMALAHAVGDAVERAYRRGDLLQKRRQLMDAWARYCAIPARAGAVVPFRAESAYSTPS